VRRSDFSANTKYSRDWQWRLIEVDRPAVQVQRQHWSERRMVLTTVDGRLQRQGRLQQSVSAGHGPHQVERLVTTALDPCTANNARVDDVRTRTSTSRSDELLRRLIL